MQVVAPPLQFRQGDEHARQSAEDTYVVSGHVDTHDPLWTLSTPVHAVQFVGEVPQAEHGAMQSKQTDQTSTVPVGHDVTHVPEDKNFPEGQEAQVEIVVTQVAHEALQSVQILLASIVVSTGQLAIQVLLWNFLPATHVKQFETDVSQVAQSLLHAEHVVPIWTWVAEHEATQFGA